MVTSPDASRSESSVFSGWGLTLRLFAALAAGSLALFASLGLRIAARFAQRKHASSGGP